MIGFVFRWVFPAVGLAFLAFGLAGAQQRGDPPLASLWGARVQAVVVSAGIVETEAQGGWPHTEIRVAWPPGSGKEATVGALSMRARPAQRAALERHLAQFPVGSAITVRTAFGRPFADHTDLFALAWTLGAVLIGSLVAAVGVFINRTLR